MHHFEPKLGAKNIGNFQDLIRIIDHLNFFTPKMSQEYSDMFTMVQRCIDLPTFLYAVHHLFQVIKIGQKHLENFLAFWET